MSATVSARRRGSSASGGFGRPWATSQKLQRRVHTSPRIMKVAVPWPKHSWMLGQLASSHTVTRRLARSLDFSCATALPDGIRTRIQDGLRSTGASANCTGERAILSPATCFTPGCSDAGAVSSTTERGMALLLGSDMGGSSERRGRRGAGRQPELPGEVLHQHRLDRLHRRGTAEVYHRGHLQPRVATGIDAPERLQVHVDVEGQPVEAAAAPDPDPEGGDLGPGDVHARRSLAARGADVPVAQGVDDRLLDAAHVIAHTDLQPA